MQIVRPLGISSLTDRESFSTRELGIDAYFSADVETDGPIPGPYSILSFALVYAGSFDGVKFERPQNHDQSFYREVRPISNEFDTEALRINGLDRERLVREGAAPTAAMKDAYEWITKISTGRKPVLVAYPLSFDWSWLYWYFLSFSEKGSPFEYSRCYDIKTAYAVKAGAPISASGRSKLPNWLLPNKKHTHHAMDDAIEQAEIFANVFEWSSNEADYKTQN